MPEPTIIIGSLNDSELKKSIESLVNAVDEGTKKMKSSFDSTIEAMKSKLGELGKTSFEIKAATAAQTSLGKVKTEAKEVSMTFDQIVEGLRRARGEVREFNIAREQSLPSRKSYLTYEQSLARISDFQEKLKLSALSLAHANERAFAFDAKRTISELSAVDERYNKLARWYSVLEKEDQRRIARQEKENQNQITRQEKLTQAAIAEINKYNQAQDKMRESAAKTASKLDFYRALKMPTETVDQMREKLAKLKDVMDSLKDKGILSPSQIASTEQAISKLEQKINSEVEAQKRLNDEIEKQKKIQATTQPPTAKESFYNFVDLYTQKVAALKQELANMPTATFQRVIEEYKKWQSEIDETKKRIQELKERINNVVNPNAKNSLKSMLAEQEQRLEGLYKKQTAAANAVIKSAKEEADVKRRSYDEMQRQINELIGKQQQAATTDKARVATAKEYTEEVRKQAEEIRKQASFQKVDVFGNRKGMLNINGQVVPVFENLEKGLTLEESIIQAQQRVLEQQKRINEEKKKGVELSEADKKAADLLWGTPKSRYIRPVTNVEQLSEIRAALQSITGTQEKWVDEINKSKASYNQLSQYLKELKGQFYDLGQGTHKSATKVLANEIQDVERKMRLLNQEMSRPVSLEAAKALPVNTIDDIIYKIQKLNEYKRGLNLFDDKQKAQITEIDNEINKLNKDLNKYTQTTRQAKDMSKALGRSWNYMKNRLAFYFTVGASTQFVKNLIDIRSQYEMNERALGILINSAERGTQIFNELSQMALVSPYTLIELSAAAKQLTAYDIAARDVVDTTRRLADMAAAVGIPIERLTYALGQVKAYGYLNARDARMFSNAGIPLVKQLSDYYTQLEGRMVSVADIYDKIKKKAIDYNTVMTVVTRMTDEGGKFFDFQAKMADTLKVRLANLTLAWNNMLNEIGKETQGMLTFTIDGLKKLFLHWRDFDRLIREAATGYGFALGLMMLNTAITRVYGSSGRLLKLFTAEAVLGTKLANVIRSISAAMGTLIKNPLTWALFGAMWFMELANAISNANEATKELNQSLRESAKTSYDELRNYLDTSANKNLRSDLSNGDINVEEAKKSWEAMREQIELSSRNSEEYVQQLMKIENVSERLRQGFSILESISSVKAGLKELGDDTIQVSQKWSAWWNAWKAPDGLVKNLSDWSEELKKINKEQGQIKNSKWVETLSEDYQKFSADVKETTDSIDKLIEKLGYTGDVGKINEVYSTAIGQIIEKNGISPDDAFRLQLKVEEARSAAAKRALKIRLDDEKAALTKAADEQTNIRIIKNIDALNKELSDFDKNNGKGRVLWAEYTKWLKERHISEVRETFREITDEELRNHDLSRVEWQKFAKETADKFAKEHNLATDEVFTLLHNWVLDANKWSIFIPLVISSDGNKSLYETFKELDSQVDAADEEIKRMQVAVSDLKSSLAGQGKIPFVARTQEQHEKYADTTRKLAQAEKELAAAEKRRADAKAQHGHGKQEERDSKAAAKAEAKRRRDEERERRKRERADAKARREEESELEKALKNELSLIDKIRSAYKSLTDSGMSHTQAITAATRGYDKTVKQIDSVLGKWGIANFDLSKYAGISNPHDLVALLQSQLDTILASGRAKPAEIKDFEVKIQDLHLDAEKYDLEKIKKGLNSELDKLNDEYELSLELADNPALASVFADMFNIDALGLPQTIDEYMDAAQKKFDDTAKSLNILGDGLDIFKASKDDWYAWGKSVGYTEEQVDEFKSSFNGAIDKVKKWATDTINETQELEYRLGDLNEKILIEEDKKEKIKQAMALETNELQLRLLELQLQAQEEVIDKLKEELYELLPTYKALFGGVAEHSASLTRKLAKQLKDMLERATDNGDNTYTVTDPRTKQKATISKKKLGSELNKVNKEIAKSQSSFSKIREAFTKGEDGEIDFAMGIELIGEELKKLSELINTIGDITAALGLDEESQEVIGDVANSIAGLGQAAEGYAKIQSGDIIGGATDIISGVWKSVSTWLDNSDKKITREINKSKRAVQELEMAYNNLQHAIESSLGAGEIYARKNALTNKQLQLQEKERQLELEKSRKKKHRDEDAILSLENEINDLRNEIDTLVSDVANTLLGSDIKSAAEDFVSTWVGAWRQGENTMDAIGEKFDSMIDTMIAKSLASKVVAQRLKPIYDIIDTINGTETDEQMQEKLKQIKEFIGNGDFARGIDDFLTTLYGYLGIGKGSGNANLSALQQGIQSITEDTAGALEAYMNSVSQQVYYQSDILTQIRDAVVMFNTDVQVATIGQILLQLQASYQVQMTIQNTLDGWSSPNGQSVRVEMI